MASFYAKFERLGRERPLLFSLLIVLALMLLVLAIFTPGYQTNDDPVMDMIASGRGIVTEPDEHLVFTNVAIGLVLKQLYTWSPDRPWYGTYLLLTHLLAHTALLYSVVVWRYRMRYVRLYVIYFFTVGLYFICNLQFTTTAFLAAQAGIVLALTCLVRRSDERACRIWPAMTASAGLLILASLIRVDSYFAMLAVAAPVSAWAVLRCPRREVVRPALTAALLVLLVSGGMHRYHRNYYESDPEWAGFFEYNAIRVKFNDYQWTKYTPETRPVFDSAGWSENDHAMLANWFYENEELYSVEKMQQVLSGYPWYNIKTSLRNVREGIRDILADKYLTPLWLLVPFIFWRVTARRTALTAVLLTLGVTWALFIYLSLFAKSPPSRVYYPLCTFPFALLLLLARMGPDRLLEPLKEWFVLRTNFSSGNGRAQRQNQLSVEVSGSTVAGFLICLALVGVSICVYQQMRRNRELRKSHNQLVVALDTMEPRDDELFVSWGACFPMESILPLERPSRLGNLRLLVLGWPSRTPHHKSMKERFGITDVTEAIYARENVHLVANDVLNPLYVKYAREHHNTKLECTLVFQSMLYSVYKIRPSNKPDDEEEIDRTAIRQIRNWR